MEEIITDKENQHYIPKFYLRYFSFENNKRQIGVFNQKNKKYIQSAKLKTQASKKYFYGKDGIIEDLLSTIESTVSRIISKIITSEELPELMSGANVDLLFFIILMDLRNPIKIAQYKSSRHLVIEQLINFNPNKRELEAFKAIDKLDSHDEDVKMVIFMVQDIVPYCMDLNIKLLKNTTDIPFITSDYPLIKYNQFLENKKWNIGQHNGYGSIGKQMFLPITENYMLILFDPDVYEVGNNKEKVVVINDINSINQLNMLQVLNCSDSIFFNHRVTESYINNLTNSAYKYKKANEIFSKLLMVVDEKGITKQNENVIRIGLTELKTNLNLQKIKYSYKTIGIKLDNCVVQLRPKVKQLFLYKEKQKHQP